MAILESIPSSQDSQMRGYASSKGLTATSGHDKQTADTSLTLPMEEQLLEHWFNGLCGAEELRSSQKEILTVAEVPAKLQPQLRSFVLSVTSNGPE